MIPLTPPDGEWTGASIAEHLGLDPADVVLVGDVLEVRTDLTAEEVAEAMATYAGPPPPPPTEEERMRALVEQILSERSSQ